jgi:hypothetical protein
MKKHTKTQASILREACRRTAREYCPMYKAVILRPCYTCPLVKGDRDCKGNSVGERDRLLAITRQSILAQFAIQLPAVGHERNSQP